MAESKAKLDVKGATGTRGRFGEMVREISLNGVWDYDAPMYVDFERIAQLRAVHDDHEVDDSSYFTVDHESARAVSLGVRPPAKNLNPSADNPRPTSLPSPAAQSLRARCQVPAQAAQRQVAPHDALGGESQRVASPYNVAPAGESCSSNSSESDQGIGGSQLLDVMADVPRVAKFPINEGMGAVGGANRESWEQRGTGRRSAVGNVRPRSPSPSFDYTSDEDDNFVPARSGTEPGNDSMEPAAPSVVIDQAQERGRIRFVDVVTSAKKRLSMSVDRGENKLRQMRTALLDAALAGEGEEGEGSGGGAEPRLGSLSDALDVEPSNASPARNAAAFKQSGREGRARRRILGSMENLVGCGPLPAVGGAGRLRPARRAAVQRTIAETSGEFRLDDADDFVRALTSNNEAVVARMNGATSHFTTTLQPSRLIDPRAVVPHVGVPFNGAVTRAKLTMTRPFSFELRDRSVAGRREERLRRIIEEEKKARQFHAQPFPDIIYANPTGLINYATRRESKPAQGATVIGLEKGFKARPPTVLTKAPFVPRKSNKPVTEVLRSFEESAARRADKRAELEVARRARITHEELQQHERARKRVEEEQIELRRMRQLTVHRAQPIRFYRAPGRVKSAHPASAQGVESPRK